MKQIKYVFIIFLFCSSVILGAEKPFQDTRWFDIDGAFHVGDPLPYVNQIVTGVIDKPELAATIQNKLSDMDKITQSELEQLSSTLHLMNTPFSIYLPSSDSIETLHKKTVTHFKTGLEKQDRGSIELIGYGVQNQGQVSLIEGSEVNTLILIPADPKLVAKLPSPSEQAIGNVEMLMRQVVKEQPWMEFSVSDQMNASGKVTLKEIVPGPYIVWVNQRNMMTYLYRTIIKANKNTTLTLIKSYSLGIIRLKSSAEKTTKDE